MFAARVIPHIIDRHAEDAAFLWLLRAAAVTQPHYDLADLAELDERLLANLDGLVVAGAAGWQAAAAQLASPEPGEVFVATWLAAHAGDGGQLNQVLQYAFDEPDNRRALIAALAWHPLPHTQPLLDTLLHSDDPNLTAAALRVLAVRRENPGTWLEPFLDSPHSQVLAAALRACGELQRRDLLDRVRSHYQDDRSRYQDHPPASDDQPTVAFWAQWAGALLGDPRALALLHLQLLAAGPYAERALPVVVRALPAAAVTELLRELAANPQTERLAIEGAGMSGDPRWIPGLCLRMTNPALARVAGEALALITGLDLAYEDLDTDAPPDWEAGPSEDPDDEHVDLDPDESLPWPEPTLVTQWWQQNQARFAPGTRYLCGAAVSAEQCQTVLRSGYQRQRAAAALELTLLLGEPLFECRAPASIQQRRLAPAAESLR